MVGEQQKRRGYGFAAMVLYGQCLYRQAVETGRHSRQAGRQEEEEASRRTKSE